MVSLWSVSTGSLGEYTPEFYLLCQLSRKASHSVSLLIRYCIAWKVILAAIRDKGNCSCSCCIIPKSMFHCTGFIQDFTARISCVRTYLQDKIKLAWWVVYIFGRPLKGMTVESILKAEFLVPTLIGVLFLILGHPILEYVTELFL